MILLTILRREKNAIRELIAAFAPEGTGFRYGFHPRNDTVGKRPEVSASAVPFRLNTFHEPPSSAGGAR